MHPGELNRNCTLAVNNVVVRKPPTKVAGDMAGKISILPSQKQSVPEPLASVAVHGDDRIDVINEVGEGLGVGWPHRLGRHVYDRIFIVL